MIKRIVKLLIAIIFSSVEKSIDFFRDRDNLPGTCVVLTYHDVLSTSYSKFVRQMETMLRLATPIASDSIRNLEKGKNFIAVTFDDGFASTIEKVVPVLIDKSIPVTFFIPTAYLGNKASWITDSERRKLVGSIISVDRLQLLSKNSYVSIGSHGVNHQRLSSINNDEAFLELIESKKILEAITGTKITMHSFPFGEYDSRHVSMAKQAGYDFVFTIDPIVNYGKTETFVIGRTHVDALDWPLEFRLKVLGAYRWQPFFSRLKNIIRR